MACLILVVEPSVAGLAQWSQEDLVEKIRKGERHVGSWVNARMAKLNVTSGMISLIKDRKKTRPSSTGEPLVQPKMAEKEEERTRDGMDRITDG